jgi:hypothetical protein
MSGPMTTADDDEERQRPEVLRYTLVKTDTINNPLDPDRVEQAAADLANEKEQV